MPSDSLSCRRSATSARCYVTSWWSEAAAALASRRSTTSCGRPRGPTCGPASLQAPPLAPPPAPARPRSTARPLAPPKGAALTHRAYLLNATAFASRPALSGDDVLVCVLPLAHLNAHRRSLLPAAFARARLVLAER